MSSALHISLTYAPPFSLLQEYFLRRMNRTVKDWNEAVARQQADALSGKVERDMAERRAREQAKRKAAEAAEQERMRVEERRAKRRAAAAARKAAKRVQQTAPAEASSNRQQPQPQQPRPAAWEISEKGNGFSAGEVVQHGTAPSVQATVGAQKRKKADPMQGPTLESQRASLTGSTAPPGAPSSTPYGAAQLPSGPAAGPYGFPGMGMPFHALPPAFGFPSQGLPPPGLPNYMQGMGAANMYDPRFATPYTYSAAIQNETFASQANARMHPSAASAVLAAAVYGMQTARTSAPAPQGAADIQGRMSSP